MSWDYFGGILSDDGVYKNAGNGLEVEAGSGMSVNILTGRMRIKQHYFSVDSTENLTIDPARTVNPRYDAIVIRYNSELRSIYPYVIKGTAAGSPERPSLTRTSTIYDMCLAYIYIPANSTEITNIDDRRNDDAVCGYAELLVDSISAKIRRYSNTYTSTAVVQGINIGISEYSRSNDILDVYVNGIRLIPTEEFVVEGSGSQARVVLVNPMDSGNVFEFVVTKAEVTV